MSKLFMLSLAAVIPWQHPSLELYRAGVSAEGGRTRIEMCVQLKEGFQEGTTSVGYPRCRTSWGRWMDCVIAGIDRSGALHASAETGPACFSVLAPPAAVAIDLSLGDRTLEMPVMEPDPGPPLAEAAPPPQFVSDVDGDVPASLSSRPRALAVILGVGTYANAPAATFAAADAKTAAHYFQRSLGIPASRIEMLLDGEVTLGQMQRIFGADGWLARRVSPDSEIFVYFAGHGMVEPEELSPYLVPADADPDYLHQTALSLDRMIELIAALSARRTTLFLDACFAGLSREGALLLEDARPLLIEPAARRVPARLSIFSAGSGSQTASALDGEGHGLFSYYLFKGVAGAADHDHDRRVLASELKDYLEEAVPRAALSLDREQTPGITLADPEEVLVQFP